MNMPTNTLESLASYTLHNSNVSLALHNTPELHPLTFFVECTAQKREDLMSHPQVKSLLFLSKNNLIEMFFPRIIKESDSSGLCISKVGGVIGKIAKNCSIWSISTSEAFSDFITCWTKDNLIIYSKGEEITSEMFHQTVDSDKEKLWTPSLTLLPYFVCQHAT